MAISVDLTNLRTVTDGNPALEIELFQSFFNSSLTFIKNMREACTLGQEDNWRNSAHALRGICLNLGAIHLETLCKNAQNDFRAPDQEKLLLLVEIEHEYTRVKLYLDQELVKLQA